MVCPGISANQPGDRRFASVLMVKHFWSTFVVFGCTLPRFPPLSAVGVGTTKSHKLMLKHKDQGLDALKYALLDVLKPWQ